MDENGIEKQEEMFPHPKENSEMPDEVIGREQLEGSAEKYRLQDEAISNEKAKSVIESLFFINERPIETKELIRVSGKDKKEIETLIEELTTEYRKRFAGICIIQVAGGYQMCSSPENEPWVKKMYRERSKQKLSIASLETLAIIAYKQPVTRMEIESIRGVNADGVVKKLTELGLIKIGGRKEVIGNPFLYITTRKFLEYFGLNSLKDLPKLEEFVTLAETDKVVREVTQSLEQELQSTNNEPDMVEKQEGKE